MKFGIIRAPKVAHQYIQREVRTHFQEASFIDIETIGSSQTFFDFDYMIVPGTAGEVCHYWEFMVENKNRIQEQIQTGMGGLFICAGNYSLWDMNTYTKNDGEVRTAEGMGILKGHVHGPIKDENGTNQMRVVPICYNHSSGEVIETKMYYDGGPTIMSDDIINIATFKSLPAGNIAIGARKIGHGFVIFSSVLFDLSVKDMAIQGYEQYPQIKKLVEDMLPYEKDRKRISNDILRRMQRRLN